MTTSDTNDDAPNRDARPMNMHTDTQHGATPLNMHTDVVVSGSGSTVTITGRTEQGGALSVTLPKQVADLVRSKVPHHVTSTPHAASPASAADPVAYRFGGNARVSGDATHGIVVTGPATSQGVTSDVELTFTPTAVGYLGAQRADL